MFEDDPVPSKEDLNLLNNLSIQGENILEDLYTIFSYHRPKEYKIYVENIKYNPLDKNKILLDLITTIQKYDKFVKKQKDIYKDLGEDNKYFFKLYHGRKLFGKSVTADTYGEILNNILPKYEQEKHMIFEDKFLKKNIFHKSGLLSYTFAQNVDFFDEEIRKLGIDNYKPIKYITFIEKLYKEIQNNLERQAVNTFNFTYENKAEKLFKLRQEKILKANMDKVRKKEIKFEKKEIRKLKKLIDIANETYEKIMENINSSNRRNKKLKTHSESKKDKNENDNYNNIEEDNKIEKNEKNIRILKLIKKEKSEEKESDSKFSSKYINKQNRTLFSEGTNNTNNTTFFNRNTTSTGYGDTKSSNHFTFYNIRNDLLNKLKTIKLKKEKEKEKAQLKFKPLQINTKTFSRNKIKVSFFPKISKNTINEPDNNINTMTSPMLNSTSNIFKLLKPNSSAPSILNMESQKENNDIEQIQETKVIKKLIKKKKFLKKKLKGQSVALNNEKKKNVPIVYEQLKKLRNALELKRKNTNLNTSSKTYELLSKIYTKKKIFNVNEQKMPKELYNTYYKMSKSIDNNKTSEVFKRYKKMMDDNIDHNLDKIKEQDENLKTKYLDFIHALVNKKLL